MYDKSDPTAPTDSNVFELETKKGTKLIQIEMPPIEPVNAIKMELEMLAKSIHDNQPTKVTIEDGYRAWEVAYGIMDKINE